MSAARARRLAALTALAAWLPAQTPVVTWSQETMRLRSATVAPAGGSSAFAVGLTMENDNANAGLPTSFRRWWHCQIANLNPAGTTLTVTVGNAGYSDVILPVWALSSDGVTFGAYQRCPTSAVPTQPSGSQHRFTLPTPPGVVAIRLAKYFPYSVARKDAWLQSLAGHPRLVATSVLGTSVQGRPIQLLEFTDSSRPSQGKRRVWIHAGIHPAETTSYFTVEGLVQWLGSGDPYAELLLDRAIVDIVPMANPDGVALGNYRVNANSVNLENEWAAPYASNQPEILALRSRIEQFQGTLAAPGANPVEVLLNLHSSHNVGYPFHFQHVANATWDPATNNSGVIPVVHQRQGQWILGFRQRSPFVNRGTTQTSTAGAPTRPFVESMMHDRWSAQATWTGAPNFREPVMAITFEGTYGFGPSGTQWNTEADYRLCGAQLGRALVDYLGLQLTAQALPYGAPCTALALQGSLQPTASGHQATLGFAGAPAFGIAAALFGLQAQAVPLPAPWQNCLLRSGADASVLLVADAVGFGGYSAALPNWPGLSLFTQVLALDPAAPGPGLDSSNGVELRNDF